MNLVLRVQGLERRVFERPIFFWGVGFRVRCNCLVLELGGLNLQVNLFSVKIDNAIV